MGNNIRWSKENLEKIILSSNNKAQVLKKLDLKPYTGNYDTLNKYIHLYNIDYSHFKIGFKSNNTPKNKKSLKDIFISGSTYLNGSHIKKRLYDEGLKKPICEKCGQNEWWYGEKISLILDHINGIKNDNRLENLRIVCPNCNATLPTHCGKNKKNKSSAIYQHNIKKCKCGKKLKSRNITGYCKKCLSIQMKMKNNNYCECGKQIKKNSTKCVDCHNKLQRKVKRPSHEQLLNEVKELGYLGTGRKYGVSDNAIRKWLKK